MKRIALIATILIPALFASHEAADASCPSGQYYNVPVQDPACASCCTGSLPKQGCKAYECSSGQLSSGWGTATTCPPYPTCNTSCGTPSSECFELCENAVDDDGDGIADEGCVGDDTCTSPGGCQARNSTSPSRGTAYLPEPADWSIPGVGPGLAFRRVYQSGWYRPFTSPASNTTALGHGWSHNFMARVVETPGSPQPSVIVTGMDGREIGFNSTTNTDCGTGNTQYKPTKGHYVKWLCKYASPTSWELRELFGQRLKFDSGGKLTEVHSPDSGATAIKLTVSYTSNKVSSVSDFRGETLSFTYFSDSDSTRPGFLQKVSYRSADVTFGYSGSRLTTVTYPGSVSRTYTYDAEGFLASISDAAGKTLHGLDYVANSYGQVAHETTSQGDVAYRYTGTACTSGETEALWNKTTTTCSTDSNCSGGYCGFSGKCYSAHQCEAWSNSGEHVATDIAGACASCAAVLHWEWFSDSTTLELRGLKRDSTASGDTKTSYQRNSNGQVTRTVVNDDDYVASTDPSWSPFQTIWLTYDTNFPNLPASTRTKSTLSTSTCNDSTETGCAKTATAYSSTGHPTSIVETGFTKDISGTTVSHSHTTSLTWDSHGRLTEINGPRTDVTDKTEYFYYTGTGDNAYRLSEVRRHVATAPGGYLSTTYDQYDKWGNAKKITDENGNVTCRSYDADRGWLTTERRVINGASDCSTTGSDDITTSYTRDGAGRVTKLTRPLGNCFHYTHDSQGRVTEIKKTDDCNASSSGDRIVYTLDTNGDVTKTEWKNEAGTVTRSQEQTFGADGRVFHRKNPVDATKVQEMTYDGLGSLTQTLFEDNSTAGSRTDRQLDAIERQTLLRRYTGSSTYDDITLSYTTTGGGITRRPTSVTDGNGNATTFVYDDLGRTVEEVSPDRGTTRSEYHTTHSVLTKIKEGVGSSVEETTSFTFDALGRMTAKEVGGSTCSRTPAIVGPDVAFYYDAVPSGETCPISGGCTNPKDRLVLATFEVKCNGTSPDLGKDWFAYDKIGRTTAEHRVALGRTDIVVNAYDKNSHPTSITTPAGYGIGFTYGGGSGDNSDADDPTKLTLVTTDWLTGVAWHPSGPTKSWTQANKKSGTNLALTDTRNAAYRNTRIEVKSGTTEYLDLVYDEDSRGRYKKKDNDTTNADPTDSFYKYDPKSRLTCDAKADVSTCPGSGDSNLKSNIGYNAGDNRTSFVFSNPKVADTHTYAYETGTNKLADITKASTYKIDYGYNTRGMRTVDDDLERSNDTRNFAYYPSGALASITGKTPSTGGNFDDYVMAQAADHEGRRIFKGFKNTTTGAERQWYFSYDLQSRLTEVRRIDDVNTSTCTGQTDLFLWVGQKPVVKYAITWTPSGQNCNVGAVGRHFIQTDHVGTPMVLTSWPVTGDAAISWSASYDAFGWAHPSDETFYQPFRFPGQHADPETDARHWDGSAYKLNRPGISSPDGADAGTGALTKSTGNVSSAGPRDCCESGNCCCVNCTASHGCWAEGSVRSESCVDRPGVTRYFVDCADTSAATGDPNSNAEAAADCLGAGGEGEGEGEPEPYCGDGTCNGTESCCNCRDDCGWCYCGPRGGQGGDQHGGCSGCLASGSGGFGDFGDESGGGDLGYFRPPCDDFAESCKETDMPGTPECRACCFAGNIVCNRTWICKLNGTCRTWNAACKAYCG